MAGAGSRGGMSGGRPAGLDHLDTHPDTGGPQRINRATEEPNPREASGEGTNPRVATGEELLH